MTNRIAFITYETPFAPSGGVTAVMNYLPEKVEGVSGFPTVIITPYHFKIAKTTSLAPSLTRIGEFQVFYRSSQIRVEILEYDRRQKWIFLKVLDKPAREPPFFSGERHPYDVSPDKTKITSILTRDSMFFGMATVSALSALDSKASWIILMQDWEAATTVLSSQSSTLSSQSSFHLTLHNSYDSGLPASNLKRFAIDPKLYPGETVLNRSLPQIKNPIYTVSGQFAKDLTNEVFQSKALAPHLVDLLESRILGINNGPFSKLAVDQNQLDQACLGNYEPLQAWKKQRKEIAFAALTAFQPTEDRPLWGNVTRLCCNEVPWFIVAGRDDPRQEGYNIACQAVTSLLEKGYMASFLFFPIPGDEGLVGLNFLRKLAARFPDNVIVLPAIFKKGFSAVTGLLYREADRFSANEANWQAINATNYRIDGGYPDQIEQRSRLPLFKAMANALESCIADAFKIYQSQTQQYSQLIVNGVTYIKNNFSWEQAAQDYFRTLV